MTTPQEPTMAAPTMAAWSQQAEEPFNYPEPEYRTPWVPALLFAGLMIAAVAVAVTTAVVLVTHRPSGPSITVPPPATTTTMVTTVVADPTTVTQTQTQVATPSTVAVPVPQTQDERYLAMFADETGLIITNPKPVIALGHRICNELTGGSSVASEIALLQTQYTNITSERAWGAVDAASAVYCPQYHSTR